MTTMVAAAAAIQWTFFTYPFHILRSLSPHSTTMNPHIFLSLSNCSLLVAGRWLPYIYRRFLPLLCSQTVCTHCQKCFIFDWENPMKFGILSLILQGMGYSSLKPIKPG
jgi:hypothetical protein